MIKSLISKEGIRLFGDLECTHSYIPHILLMSKMNGGEWHA